MSFSRWITTREPLSLDGLGAALFEVAPDIQIVNDPTSAEEGRSITALDRMTFGFAVDGATIATPLPISSSVERDRVELSVTEHGFAGEAVALGLLAAALHVAGGELGDDGDHKWSAKKVLTEYRRAARLLHGRWAEMSAEERARVVAEGER